MGVPLRRPASLAVDLFVPDVLDPAWLDVFRFCGVPDLGACLAVSKCWHSVADAHHVWADAYERTQRVDSTSAPAGEGELRALIERPFGEDAVGWRVAVLIEDGTERHATGHIVSYSAEADAYLVAYEEGGGGPGAPREAWEQERRKRTAAMRHNPSLAGKSRFSFLAPPACSWPHRLDGAAPGRRGAGRSCGSSLRFRSWKQELENNVRNAPSRLLLRLEEHDDEVLFVVFSPCGTRLASCSRDLRTVIFKLQSGRAGSGSPVSKSACSSSSCGGALPGASCTFEREAVFTHQTAPCRAIWWPIPPYTTVAVSTEDAGWQGASKVELWEVLGGEAAAPAEAVEAPEGLPAGLNARCVFQGQNRPFDIYAALLPWPAPPARPGAAQDPASLSFLSGWAVFRENEHYVQWLNVWPGPRHPRFRPGHEHPGGGAGVGQIQGPAPLARLRLEGEMNYLHCLEVGPGTHGRRILAMTGSTPHLCNELGLINLAQLQQRNDGVGVGAQELPIPTYDAPVEVKSMGERVVLSAKWSARGDLVLLNTRPYAHGTPQQASPAGRSGAPNASFEDLLLRPAPDLSTSMELLLLDARSLDTIGIFDGHFAFTTKESPFLIFTDEWSDSDFLASGGEDHRVYVWHRRHRRLVRRLCGHTEPVNAVSWNGAGFLASASDDHSIIIWAAGGAAASPA